MPSVHNFVQEYLDKIENSFADRELSYFELNLETWRQLWRVLEMSEIVLLVADIRHPVRDARNFVFLYVCLFKNCLFVELNI